MNLRLLLSASRHAALQFLASADTRRRLRRAGSVLHRYVALTVGAFLVLAGLSGSMNVFRPELDAWLNPQLTVAEPRGAYRPPDEWLAAITAVHPRRFGDWTLVLPQRPPDMVTAWFERPIETLGQDYAPLMVSVNPYTAEVVASRFWGGTFTTWILEWHETLFMGASGRKVVGGFGILLLVSLTTGLLLGWPGRPRQGPAWGPIRERALPRVLLAVHRWVGVSSAGVLMLLALTGIHLAYPGILGSVVGSSASMDVLHEALNVRSSAQPNGRPVTIEEAILLARGLYPKARVDRVQTPRDASGSYRIWFRASGAESSEAPIAVVCVDQYSGHILHAENFRNQPAGDAFLAWLRALHTGAAFGRPGKFLWCVAGFAPLLLFLTGIDRWRRRRASGVP